MTNNNTHALVSAPPRILQDSMRTYDESTAAECTSIDARTRNSMESTAFTPLNEQDSTVLEPRQAQLKLSLSSSVAQPTPPSVARRSAQTNANHKRIKNKKKRDVEAVQRAPRSPQQHRHQTNKNNKTHKIKINKNKKFKRTRDVAAGATTRMLTRMRSLIFLLICTKNLLAHCTVAQTCPSGADCTGSVSTWDVARVTDMNRSECLCLLAHGPHLHQQAVGCCFNVADNPFFSFPAFPAHMLLSLPLFSV